MVEKSRIAEVLQESGLLLPDLIDAALAANDRIKLMLTWLQAAVFRAENPGAAAGDEFAAQRVPGLDDLDLGGALGHAARDGDRYVIPGVGAVVAHMFADLDAMIAPLQAAEGDKGSPLSVADCRGRRERLAAAIAVSGDSIDRALVPRLADARRDRGDTLHLLVMDLHKALNALQSELAEETIDGARVYRVDDADRPLIAAFMRGLNRTAPLKFGHPGLGTTATRSGDRLVIQNDIGTTDAHVIVIHVTGLTVTVTYTDIHNRRLRFFQYCLKQCGFEWADTSSRRAAGLEDEDFYLATGSFTGADTESIAACLEHLGGSLVFLIDWNKARKRLGMFVPKAQAIDVLRWAADHRIGHRGFLKLGGERLIFDALEAAMSGPQGFGRPLHQILGEDESLQFLRQVLRTSTEGLLEGRSQDFVAEEIRADLLTRLKDTVDQTQDLVLDHAALVRDTADLVQQALIYLPIAEPGTARQARRQRAKAWETEADRLVMRVRSVADHNGTGDLWRKVIEAADDAADNLEEALFQISLMPESARASAQESLVKLAQLVTSGVQDYVRLLFSARYVTRGGAREEMRAFLSSVEQLRAMEHATDDAERDVMAALMQHPADPRSLMLERDVADLLESAGDALLHAGLFLSDHVLTVHFKGPA